MSQISDIYIRYISMIYIGDIYQANDDQYCYLLTVIQSA